TDESGETALMLAIDSLSEPYDQPQVPQTARDQQVARRIPLIQWLMAHGAELEAEDNQGRTALELAASKNQTLTIEALLARGADASGGHKSHREIDSWAFHWPPLGWAAYFDNLRMAKALIARGAQVNPPGNHVDPPLLCTNVSEMLRLLLDHGA